MLGNINYPHYDKLMSGDGAYIEVVIDVRDPIELGDFVSAFTSIANQYQRFMKLAHPDIKGDAHVYVREVRPGSIIADLLPSMANLIGFMDQVLIIEQFVRVYGERLGAYFVPGGRADDASKGELKDFMGQVAAISRSKHGRGAIRAVTYEDKKRKIRASVEFNASDATCATEQIENHKRELDSITTADYERVLMTFKRSDIGSAEIGIRSGERVIIEDISNADLALIYGSPLSEQRIKDQMRNIDENIYHKGFVVDVNVQTRNRKPIAYAVTNVHQIIDIPPD